MEQITGLKFQEKGFIALQFYGDIFSLRTQILELKSPTL